MKKLSITIVYNTDNQYHYIKNGLIIFKTIFAV